MKLTRLILRNNKFSKKQTMEDLRYLQKKISGSSVYSNIKTAYRRLPKHRSRDYMSEINALRGN